MDVEFEEMEEGIGDERDSTVEFYSSVSGWEFSRDRLETHHLRFRTAAPMAFPFRCRLEMGYIRARSCHSRYVRQYHLLLLDITFFQILHRNPVASPVSQSLKHRIWTHIDLFRQLTGIFAP